MSDFRRRIDGEDEIGPGPASAQNPQAAPYTQRQNFGPSQKEQLYGVSKMAERGGAGGKRRSTDQDRYDADPKVLGDDLSELELRDEGLSFPAGALLHPPHQWRRA